MVKNNDALSWDGKHTFSEAIECVLNGGKARCSHWNQGTYIDMQDNLVYINGMEEVVPYFFFKEDMMGEWEVWTEECINTMTFEKALSIIKDDETLEMMINDGRYIRYYIKDGEVNVIHDKVVERLKMPLDKEDMLRCDWFVKKRDDKADYEVETKKELLSFVEAMEQARNGKKIKCCLWSACYYAKIINDGQLGFFKNDKYKNEVFKDYCTIDMDMIDSSWDVIDDEIDSRCNVVECSMSFADALEQARQGKKIRYNCWMKGFYAQFIATENMADHKHLVLYNEDETQYQYNVSIIDNQIDSGWEVVE